MRIQRFDLIAGDLTAIAEPLAAGVEVVQLSLPRPTQTLQVTDTTGTKLASDMSLRPLRTSAAAFKWGKNSMHPVGLAAIASARQIPIGKGRADQ